jgi:hypothetical protein
MARWVMREVGVPRYRAGIEGPAEEIRQAAALASVPLGHVLPSAQPSLSSPAAATAESLAGSSTCRIDGEPGLIWKADVDDRDLRLYRGTQLPCFPLQT